MSILLLKAPDCDPRKEISATNEGIIGLRKVLEGGSFWSVSGQTCEPVCTLHVGRRGGQNSLKQCTSSLNEPQAGLLEFDGEQQQAKGELEIAEEQQVFKQSFENGSSVCKLASPFCSLPESSTASLHQLEQEFKELSLQDTKLDASISCLEGGILKYVLPFASLEGSSEFVGNCEGLLLPQEGEVTPSSIESTAGPTKLKSSLRGGYEKAGLGTRPKVHVTWAANVYDPPCTSTSHTSSQSHRRHHHPRSEHKSRHKGKGSSHSESHKKSQKKVRKSKHSSENLVSGPSVASQRGMLRHSLMLKDYIVPLEDLRWKSAKVSPLILPPKGCFLNPVLPFGERDQVTLEKIQGCRPRHVETQKLFF